MKHEYDSLKCVDGFFFISNAGASINTPNIGNSTLIIEELDWGGQDTLNTCENSFFLDLSWALEGKKTWSYSDKPLMWSRHIDFRKIFRRIFWRICFMILLYFF